MLGNHDGKNTVNIILQQTAGRSDIVIRNVSKKSSDIIILYIKNITDRQMLTDKIIKPIVEYTGSEPLTHEFIINSLIYIDNLEVLFDTKSVMEYLLKGYCIIASSSSAQYIASNTKKLEERSVEQPEIQNAIRSPRDAFNESLETNLSLIRRRIKDSAFKVDYFTLGRRTKTDVALLYIQDIASEQLVSKIHKRLSSIQIDGILDAGYVQKFLTPKSFNIFPLIGISERPDKVSASILEGKICIIVESSNIALVLPQTFTGFFDSSDDHYGNLYMAILSKVIRLVSFFSTLTLSAFYVAFVAYHPDMLPAQYSLTLAVSRVSVPVNAVFEATLMELVAELLRESSIRLPKQIGPAIGIVGTIVIGQAAVSAGLVSPLMVIIVSLSTMSSFAAPDYTIIGPTRVLRFLVIFLTAIFGIVGLVLSLTIILINLVSLDSFDVPYTAPFAPLNLKRTSGYFLSDIRLSLTRPPFLRTKDNKKK